MTATQAPRLGRTLRLGTRRSPMALAQSGQVAREITARTGREVELVGITSCGDVSQAQLTQIGGTGVFVGALRTSLLRGEIDLAVHSLKDLPTKPADGIVLAAVPTRSNPRDALAGRHWPRLADLPPKARVGTGSPRRAAQLLLLRGDIQPVAVRGNAGTRLALVERGELDAVVLGYAGLGRIDRLDAVGQVFSLDEMLPAAGQGALAVECASDRGDLAALLGSLDDEASRAATTAERAMLAALEAGCTAPVAAYAEGMSPLRLRGTVLATDGVTALRGSLAGPPERATDIGVELAAELLRSGAAAVMARIEAS